VKLKSMAARRDCALRKTDSKLRDRESPGPRAGARDIVEPLPQHLHVPVRKALRHGISTMRRVPSN
jgi:hypothetical protein